MIECACPHSANPSGHPLPLVAVALRAVAPGGHRSISYQRVCHECRQQLQSRGLLLSTQRAQQEWLIWGRDSSAQAA